MTLETYFERIAELDAKTKRLEITSILAKLMLDLEPKETAIGVYLALGMLRAPFRNLKFNMAEKMMIRAIEQAFTTLKSKPDVHKLYDEMGDLGNVVFSLSHKSTSDITSLAVLHKLLEEIALAEGSGSQDLKVAKTAAVIKQLDKTSAKYVTRMMLGITRLGFTELTVVSALAEMTGDKKLAEKIEEKYNIHPDIGLIAEQIKKSGLDGVDAIKIEPGVPVLSQKAQRVTGMAEAAERIPLAWAEFKFDGTRVQLHLNRNAVDDKAKAVTTLFGTEEPKHLLKTYTRNLEETTHQYPDIIKAADTQIKADSVILDGEAIGVNLATGEFLPFQETIQRKRKHGVAEMSKKIPLKYYVFDILYANGRSLIDLPLTERHEVLEKVIGKGDTLLIAQHVETAGLDELQDYFEESKKRKLEGLILKKPDDSYQAGARSYSWIKLKKADEKLLADSIDCVVLGYYFGKGQRSAQGIGGFLVGVYDEKTEKFKTISKIGTGLNEADWEYLKATCDKIKVKELPANVEFDKMFVPDVAVKPQIVVEIGADEISVSQTHSAGYALRFPRLLKFREDKPALECTNLKEIEKMFTIQRETGKGTK